MIIAFPCTTFHCIGSGEIYCCVQRWWLLYLKSSDNNLQRNFKAENPLYIVFWFAAQMLNVAQWSREFQGLEGEGHRSPVPPTLFGGTLGYWGFKKLSSLSWKGPDDCHYGRGCEETNSTPSKHLIRSDLIWSLHSSNHCHPDLPNSEFLGMDPRLLQPLIDGSRAWWCGDNCQQEQPYLHRALAALLQDAHWCHHQGRWRGEPQCAGA